MKYNPKVSIIIPVYNGGKYLKQAIDSAISQTYKNIEIIVINDGSNDNGKTRNIALSYKDKIKYLEKENGGVSSALNLGIKNMTGEYFSWLSHDDLYCVDKIEKQIQEISKYDDMTILYSNYSIINENGEFVDNIILNHEEYNSIPLNSIINMDINGITLLIPKKAFDDYGLFDENLRCVQDYDLWLKMMNTYKFVHTKDILGSTRVHAKQVSNVSENVVIEGNAFYSDIINRIPLKTKVKYYGSEYLFLDYLEKRLRYNSKYQSAADYISNEKKKIFDNCKNINNKIFWIIDASKLSTKEITELTKDIDKENVNVGIVGKTLKNYICLSENDIVDNKKFKYLYYGNKKIDFNKALKLLDISNATIISDYLLDSSDIILLDKYSKYLHLDFENIIVKNSKGRTIKDKTIICKEALFSGEILLNNKLDKNYTIDDEYMNGYVKALLEKNVNNCNYADVYYQVAVIHNKISDVTGNRKVSFYEACKKYNALKYSRAWNIFSKIMKIMNKGK